MVRNLTLRTGHGTKTKGRKAKVWLAGASFFGLTCSASAESIQPFWVIPSVLANQGVTVPKANAAQFEIVRSPISFTHNLNLDPAGEKPQFTLDKWTTSGFRAGSAYEVNAPLSLAFSSGVVQIQPSVTTRLNRLAQGMNFAHGQVGANALRSDVELWGGRIKFSTDFLQPLSEQDPRDFRDLQLRDQPRAVKFSESSRRHKVSAKLIDTEHLKLMVDADYGRVSDELATRLDELPTGELILPTQWSSFATRLEFGRANLSVGYQDHVGRHQSETRKKVKFGFSKSELEVYRRQGAEFSLINGGQWLKKTTFSGINADLIVADVLPDAVAEFIDPIRPFLPTSVSANFEKGDVHRAEFTVGPRDKISTGHIAMTWNTSWGETTASAWERRVKTDLISPIEEEGRNLSSSQDRYIDLKHRVKSGNWKFGAGLSLIQTNDEILGQKFNESEVAPHVSIAYEPERGPKVELRVGAAGPQSQLVNDNLSARSKTKQVQLSVDLSNFIQDELNRSDAQLKLEYRYDFNGGDKDPVTGREREGGHAVLLTFSTPLN